ncbi:hypothetical protein CK486_11330 [Pseudomonas sp. HAR-UPW-AIA-41]|nr:hypothetical protein CK486_11330 [Pseudomonas sp. HAR-UPW-AIA-41]
MCVRWLMFCLVSVPFVVPFRWYPDGDFFSDTIAVFFALLFVIASKELRCSSLVLIGFSLAGLILVAGVLGGSAYMEAWLAPALMVLVGSLFLGSMHARDPAELQRDWDAVLYGLVLGGGCSLVLGLGQIFEWGWISFLTFDGAIGVVANIGGRNQFSLYVLLGFLAFLVLLVRSALSVWWRCAVVVVVASLCSFVLVSSGSRSVVLMVFSVLVLAIFRLYFWRNDRFSYYFLIFAGVFFLTQLLSVLWPDYFSAVDGGSGFSRIQNAYADTRWVEWAKAWSIFLEHPFGVGFGNYAFFSFAATQMPSLVWSNPHNVILHFLVETGFVGAALIVFGFVVVTVGCFRYLRMAEGGVILPAAIGSFILHNLLEYSFWYANFFLCFLIFLAFLPTSGRVLRFVSGRVVSLVFLVLLLVSAVQYCRLLSAVWLPDSKSRVARIVVSAQVGLNPFLSWRADKVFMDFIPYDDGPDLVVRFCRLEDMARREPLPQYLERMAFLAMVAEDHDLYGGILKARYRRLSDTSGYYFESAVKTAWPLAAERVIRDFKERKLEGFKSYEEYQLGESGVCDGG